MCSYFLCRAVLPHFDGFLVSSKYLELCLENCFLYDSYNIWLLCVVIFCVGRFYPHFDGFLVSSKYLELCLENCFLYDSYNIWLLCVVIFCVVYCNFNYV